VSLPFDSLVQGHCARSASGSQRLPASEKASSCTNHTSSFKFACCKAPSRQELSPHLEVFQRDQSVGSRQANKQNLATMVFSEAIADPISHPQRDRSRSPRRRSRSPRQPRRSYSPRSRSRSREGYRRSDRRSRSPLAGTSGAANSQFSGRGGGRDSEDRFASKEQMMSNVRDNSQQDRRVYVGNLSYDVKWHHLKDFMRQGK
jgi:hypothetical protein